MIVVEVSPKILTEQLTTAIMSADAADDVGVGLFLLIHAAMSGTDEAVKTAAAELMIVLKAISAIEAGDEPPATH